MHEKRLYGQYLQVKYKQEEQRNEKWVSLLFKYQVPLVACNSVCFEKKEDYHAHEVRTCVDAGVVIHDKTRAQNFTEEQYYKSAIQMNQLFSHAPEVLENTNDLAKRCNVSINMGDVFYKRHKYLAHPRP